VQPESFAAWEPTAVRKPANFEVRIATAADVDACVDLAASIGLAAEGWRETLTRTVLDGTNRVLFVADCGGVITGYGRIVFASPTADDPAATPEGWYLLGLVVGADWRRRGIGEALTKARLSWVADRAERVYCLTSDANLASQALHHRLGFVERPGEWLGPGADPARDALQRLYVAELGAVGDAVKTSS
jgi:GNAT superfamily N-acetyltransferase